VFAVVGVQVVLANLLEALVVPEVVGGGFGVGGLHSDVVVVVDVRSKE